MTPEEFSALVQSRHSVRDFLPKPIPDEVLAEILDDTRHAPSWSNTRGYALAIASGEQADRLRHAYLAEFEKTNELRAELRAQGAGATAEALANGSLERGDFNSFAEYPEPLLARKREVGYGLYEHMGIGRKDFQARTDHTRRNLEFFGAPTVVLVFVHEAVLPWTAQDAGLMLQTFILSAQAHGLGTCGLGVLANWRGPADQEFEVPDGYKLITGLAVGYESDADVNKYAAPHPPVELLGSKA